MNVIPSAPAVKPVARTTRIFPERKCPHVEFWNGSTAEDMGTHGGQEPPLPKRVVGRAAYATANIKIIRKVCHLLLGGEGWDEGEQPFTPRR